MGIKEVCRHCWAGVVLSLLIVPQALSMAMSPFDSRNLISPTMPKVGEWHAVYTEEFAKKYNLPADNIAKDMPEKIPYMEMVVIENRNAASHPWCQINFLKERPHDIALYHLKFTGIPPLEEGYKKENSAPLLKLVSSTVNHEKLRAIPSLEIGQIFYPQGGFRTSTTGFYAPDFASDLDYFKMFSGCSNFMNAFKYGKPYGFVVRTAKASIWGKYTKKYPELSSPGRPNSTQEFEASYDKQVIPLKLIDSIFNITK